MAKWKDNRSKHDGDKSKDNGGNSNDKSKDNKDKEPKYKGMKVPASTLFSMEQGAAELVTEGGNRIVHVAQVRNVQLPVTRELDLALVDVVVTDGPMKGAVATWVYHTTQDITLHRNDKVIKQEKQAKRREMWNTVKDFITFKWW